MEEILNIPKPKNIQHIFWEHAMKSVFAGIITYSIMFFVPIWMFGKKENSSYIQEKGELINRYLNENPLTILYLCLIIVLILNLYLHLQNNKKKYVFKIEVSDSKITFFNSNSYYKSLEEKTYKLDQVKLLLITSRSESGKKSTIRFFDKEFSRIIGDITLDHVLFHSSKKEALTALQKLHQKGIQLQKVIGKSKNYSEKVLATLTGWK